jgi:hypothetical protein
MNPQNELLTSKIKVISLGITLICSTILGLLISSVNIGIKNYDNCPDIENATVAWIFILSILVSCSTIFFLTDACCIQNVLGSAMMTFSMIFGTLSAKASFWMCIFSSIAIFGFNRCFDNQPIYLICSYLLLGIIIPLLLCCLIVYCCNYFLCNRIALIINHVTVETANIIDDSTPVESISVDDRQEHISISVETTSVDSISVVDRQDHVSTPVDNIQYRDSISVEGSTIIENPPSETRDISNLTILSIGTPDPHAHQEDIV